MKHSVLLTLFLFAYASSILQLVSKLHSSVRVFGQLKADSKLLNMCFKIVSKILLFVTLCQSRFLQASSEENEASEEMCFTQNIQFGLEVGVSILKQFNLRWTLKCVKMGAIRHLTDRN